jgi:hypothetical protein
MSSPLTQSRVPVIHRTAFYIIYHRLNHDVPIEMNTENNITGCIRDDNYCACGQPNT